MKSISLSILFLVFSVSMVWAQENKPIELSLHECIRIAVEKNIKMQTARIDQEKSKYKITETRAALLPQITVNGSFQDNLKLPVTVFPGEFLGKPGTTITAIMGSTYNANANINISQKLYNQAQLIALRIANKESALKDLDIEKASKELAVDVAKSYFLSLTTALQKKLIEENIVRTEHLRDISKVLVDNGQGKKVDYERVCVNLETLYTDLNNSETTLAQQLNMIKYMLQIPLDKKIVLTDKVEIPLLLAPPQLTSDFSHHIDIQILESQKEISRLNQKEIETGALPSLSFTGQYANQGLRQNFKNYFNSSSENNWYSSAYVGVSLSIPIFDGLERRSKSRQAMLDYKEDVITLDDTKKHFTVDYENAVNTYRNEGNNVTRQKQNVALAENVYKETALKYHEGLETMSTLLQDRMELNNAQSSYLSALYNFKEAELSIMSLNGEIKGLIDK